MFIDRTITAKLTRTCYLFITTEFNGVFHWLEVRGISQVPDESRHEKSWFLQMRKTKTQISLRMQIRWFCYDAAQINTILMAELFLEMTQWKNLMSAWVHVLDFTKSLVYRQKMFIFIFSFMCHVCVLSLIYLFIISGEFDALHQLSVNKKRYDT